MKPRFGGVIVNRPKLLYCLSSLSAACLRCHDYSHWRQDKGDALIAPMNTVSGRRSSKRYAHIDRLAEVVATA
jgi:hypothetical protein